MKKWPLPLAVMMLLFYSVPSFGDGIITHVGIAQNVIDRIKKGDSGIPQDIASIITKNSATERAFRGGALDSDLFVLVFPDSSKVNRSTHENCSILIASLLLKNAKTDVEKAYAYGWALAHLPSDVVSHPLVNIYVGNGSQWGENEGVKWDYDSSAFEGTNALHVQTEYQFDGLTLDKFGYDKIDAPQGYVLKPRLNLDIDVPIWFLQDTIIEGFGEAPGAANLYAAELLMQAYLGLRADRLANSGSRPQDTRFDRNFEDSLIEVMNWMKDTSFINNNYSLDDGTGHMGECTKMTVPIIRSGAGGDHSDDTVDSSNLEASGDVSFDDWLRVGVKRGNRGALFIWQLKIKLDALEALPEGTEPFLRYQKEQELIGFLRANLNDTGIIETFGEINQIIVEELSIVEEVGILNNGFSKEMVTLTAKLKEPTVRIRPEALLQSEKGKKVIIIPSGGLYGLEKSEVFKTSLDEYVKQGGTLIVFGQQHGYEFSVLPVPQEEDGTFRQVTGYGWSEDQSCQFRSSYIDTWHQILSGQSNANPSINVDGYFTDYPSNATILLRRMANGQPDLLMYEYGLGRVIVTSMFTDQALRMGQAFTEEIALVRDMISWAKSPADLPEIRRGEAASVTIEVINGTDQDASGVRISVYSPDRGALLSEYALNTSLPSTLSSPIPVSYISSTGSALGIYHIDYTLLDAQGNIIQPQAETDSGRFAVNNPLTNPNHSQNFNFSIQSDAEHYLSGSPIALTVNAWNNTDVDHLLTHKYSIGGVGISQTYTFNVPARSTASHNIVIPEGKTRGVRLVWVNGYFYDETGRMVGSVTRKGMWIDYPSANITSQTDKTIYTKNETVRINVSIKNNIAFNWQPSVKIAVMDSKSTQVFEDSKTLVFPSSESGSISTSFVLPSTLLTGSYQIDTQVLFDNKNVARTWSWFELVQSQISVAPNLPSAFNTGTNTIPFSIANTGRIDVTSGTIDVKIQDPDGNILCDETVPYTAAVGEKKTLDIFFPISSLKFGNYVLTYKESDETRTGKPTSIFMPNLTIVSLSFTRPSYYRARDVATLRVNLNNLGKFVQGDLLVTVSVPGAGYVEAKPIMLEARSGERTMNFEIPIPGTITSGAHNVNVTLTLPSGSAIVKQCWLDIPESSLRIEYSGASILKAGDTIDLTIENVGGVDTTYATEELSIKYGGFETSYGSTQGPIASREKKILTIQIPPQMVNGQAFLSLEIKDVSTGRRNGLNRLLEIKGLSSILETRTDKSSYFDYDPITGLSSIANGQFDIDEGRLRLDVYRMTFKNPDTFKHFLPKTGWAPLTSPTGIAIGSDGLVYVIDSEKHCILKFDSNGKLIIKWGSPGSGDGQFYSPQGIALNLQGIIYVADTSNHRIQIFDSEGNFISKWGSYGIGDGQFFYPHGIAVAPDGFVYVADTNNNRIQKFDKNGNLIVKWGSPGMGSGQFQYPYGVATGPDGSVYVADGQNHRIQKFDSNGNFVMKWGSKGWGDGQFQYPNGIAVKSDGSIYVADGQNHRIQKFDASGNFVSQWGSYGSATGQFYIPYGIAVDPNGHVYVADYANDRIQKFESNGNFIVEWGSSGSGKGKFYSPCGIASSVDGFIYVADSGNNRIQKFDSIGNFITKWEGYDSGDGQLSYPQGIAVDLDGFVYVVDTYHHRVKKFDSNGNFIRQWGSYGSGDKQFNEPSGIAVSPEGYVYVADKWNFRIQKFDSEGNFIAKWGSFGSGNGQFILPYSIVSPDRYVYVADTYNHRIQKFDNDGTFVAKWGGYGGGDGQFRSPHGITFDIGGAFVYVADTGNYRIQKFDIDGNFIAKWGSPGSGDGEFQLPQGITAAVNGSVYVADKDGRIQGMIYEAVAQTLFETSLPINQGTNTTQEYTTGIGTLDVTGKLYLEATLYNGLGQTVAQSGYPFYLYAEDTILSFNTDKRTYKPGERILITGRVENRAPITALNLVFSLSSKNLGRNPKLLLTEIYNILSGGSQSFVVTTTAEVEGLVELIGVVRQDNSSLAAITDWYEVAAPKVSVTVFGPDIVGNEPFRLDVEIKNTGKVEATLQFEAQSSGFGDSQTVTIPRGETKVIQYEQQIRQNTGYLLTFTGDLNQTLEKSVTYGLGGSIKFGNDGTELGVFPEGMVSVPLTLTNTGVMAETLDINFIMSPGNITQTRSYYLQSGVSISDTLTFNLTEGDYQITASSQLPTASAQASFSVRKENQVAIALSVQSQTNGLIPVNVNLQNLGINTVEGSVRLMAFNSVGIVAWSGEELLSQLSPQNSQLVTFNINPSALLAGDYTLRAELLSNSSQQISVGSSEFIVRSSNFRITQLPPYQTFYPGEEAAFTFRVRNTGNQEGTFDLRLKAYDLIDSIRREWLKPGEERAVAFNFTLPEDLEEKDYFATYELKAQNSEVAGVSGGQIKYHLAGVKLNVSASLDKPNYNEGETAHLTINIQSPNSNPQSLFARINYAGYEAQQTFTLDGSHVLMFDVPLPSITGEKLFYGIYHESGRSVHLNSIYLHKAGELLTLITDKQVYQTGEIVSVTVSGKATGVMTLSAPGNYTETFPFTGQVAKSFALPAVMTAGTYFINGQVQTSNAELVTAVHPFDVAGIQVKVLECENDKGKYASSDTITTTFTISSNTAMAAMLKAWIVDPGGEYTGAGERSINLSSSENSLVTHQSSLASSVSGVHRLVYGVYGSGDLLLVSGSEAFDVGDAILLSISTEKKDYPANTEAVTATVNLIGFVGANLELQIDGNHAGGQLLSSNGFLALNIDLGIVNPGVHTLKGILTSGNLKSTRETTFIYGSSLPDLRAQLSIEQLPGQPNLRIIVKVTNQGKTSSASTTLGLYDGATGELLATLQVASLTPGESQVLSYYLNLFGRAGDNTIYGLIDTANTVAEFKEGNNRDQITFAVPELILQTTLEKDTYFTGDNLPVATTLTNLSKRLITELVLSTAVKDSSGTLIFVRDQTIQCIEALAAMTAVTSWPTDINLSEGPYTIFQNIQGRNLHDSKTIRLLPGKDFTITSDVVKQKVEMREEVQYRLTFSPIRGFADEISLSIDDCPSGFTAYFTPDRVFVTEGGVQSILKVVPKPDARPGSYSFRVNASGGGRTHALDLLLEMTDFQMVIAPEMRSIEKLGDASYTISMEPINGFDSPVTLQIDGVPKGMKAVLSASRVTLPQEITLILITSKWLLPGQYTVGITAKGKTATHTVAATLCVDKNPVITPRIITAPGPGPRNEPIINTFEVNGVLLSQFQAFDKEYGANVTAGDVDGDGIDEIIVGTVYKNSKDPALLGIFKRDGTPVAIREIDHSDKGDAVVVASGDIDDDWIEEVAVSSRASTNGFCTVKIYKIVSDQFADTGFILSPYDEEPYKKAPNIAISDVDGDGIPELITAPGPDPNAGAHIKIYKIDTKEGFGRWKVDPQWVEFFVPFVREEADGGIVKNSEARAGFGANVTAADLDGDGNAEIVVGAGPDPNGSSFVKVYSGDGYFTGIEFEAYPDLPKEDKSGNKGRFRYGAYVAAGDLDQDGRAEIITGVGPGPKNESWIRIFGGDGIPMGDGFLAYPEGIGYGVRPSGMNAK